MTKQQHPITPPPELVKPSSSQLREILDGLDRCFSRPSKFEYLRAWIRDWTSDKVSRAAQWGAEEELEACCAQISQCHLLTAEQRIVISQYLYACRRPEPPSPKKQALVALHGIAVKTDNLRSVHRPKPPSLKQQVLATLQYPKDLWSEDEVDAIRRLVEQLDD